MSTVTFYRLVKTAQVNDALDGFGARLYGGRWNSREIACVYIWVQVNPCASLNCLSISLLPIFRITTR